MTDEYSRDIAEAYGDVSEEIIPDVEAAEHSAANASEADDAADSSVSADTNTVPDSLETEVAAVASEPSDAELLSAERDKYLRLAAEFDNFRRRSRMERESLYNDVKAEMIAKFLPVFDDLSRAAEAECSDEQHAQGVKMTLSKLTGIIDTLGAKPFGETGDDFDPNKHNAVSKVKSESAAEGKIALVFEKGFILGEKIVRHAIVAVAE